MPNPIFLSSIINSEDAITAIVEQIKNIRRQNIAGASGAQFERRLYIYDSNELLFNLILGYLEGHEIHWLQRLDHIANGRDDFQLSKEQHEEIINCFLIENDLKNDGALLQLDFDHPYWTLTNPSQMLSFLGIIVNRLAQQKEIFLASSVQNTSRNNFDYIIQKEGQFLRVIPKIHTNNESHNNIASHAARVMKKSTEFRDNFTRIVKEFINSNDAVDL